MSNSVKSGQELMYSSIYFNSNYTDFVGYDKSDKSICTSDEDT